MNWMYNIGDVVEVVREQEGGEHRLGMKGVVKDVLVDFNGNTIYGVDLYEDSFIYYMAIELKSVEEE